jgi:hypothetical protein
MSDEEAAVVFLGRRAEGELRVTRVSIADSMACWDQRVGWRGRALVWEERRSLGVCGPG